MTMSERTASIVFIATFVVGLPALAVGAHLIAG